MKKKPAKPKAPKLDPGPYWIYLEEDGSITGGMLFKKPYNLPRRVQVKLVPVGRGKK